jgi:hypothetical protein
MRQEPFERELVRSWKRRTSPLAFIDWGLGYDFRGYRGFYGPRWGPASCCGS